MVPWFLSDVFESLSFCLFPVAAGRVESPAPTAPLDPSLRCMLGVLGEQGVLGWPETTVIVRFWILAGLFTALGLGFFYADFLRASGVV